MGHTPVNIVVLCGGLYPERDVSIRSGRLVADSLIAHGHRVLLMDLFFGYAQSYADPLETFDGNLDRVPDRLQTSAPDLDAVFAARPGAEESLIGPQVFELCAAADIVFMALHGEDGENGRLQAAFDLAGIRYTGAGYFGSALAMHKGISRTLLQCAGITVPPGQVMRQGEMALRTDFPCVVKPCSGGSSVATTIVERPEDLQEALDLVFELEAEALIERFIPGREFSVGVLGERVLPVIEICPKEGFYNYENKYQKGLAEEICPADLPPETTARIQAAAQTAHETLRLDVYSRTDFILAETGTLYCLESNTLPGMTPTSLLPQEARAAGLDFGDLCEAILSISMEKYQ